MEFTIWAAETGDGGETPVGLESVKGRTLGECVEDWSLTNWPLLDSLSSRPVGTIEARTEDPLVLGPNIRGVLAALPPRLKKLKELEV
jgi:hypothetical protein